MTMLELAEILTKTAEVCGDREVVFYDERDGVLYPVDMLSLETSSNLLVLESSAFDEGLDELIEMVSEF